MSSYRGASGAWDGGPPGAEAEYAGQRGPAPAYTAPASAPPGAMPTTDPWTGVSYSQYGPPPAYDYRAYSAAGYGYNYESSFYQRSNADYYAKYQDARTYPSHGTHQAVGAYDYPPRAAPRDGTLSPIDSRSHDRRRSYRTKSRSASPYDKMDRAYSRKRQSSLEEDVPRRSRSRSAKRKKYSSSDRSSSRSRSYSHSPPMRDKKKRNSVSSNSSASNSSFKKKSKTSGRESPTSRERSSSKSRARSRSHRTPSVTRSTSKSPKRDNLKNKKAKSHSSKDKRPRDGSMSRKRKDSVIPPKAAKKSERTSLTPPKSYKKVDRSVTPPRGYKHKDRRSQSPMRKGKDSSLTPPKSYARRSLSSSKSHSRSPSTRYSTRKSSRHSRSHSSSRSESSTPPRRSPSKSKRKTKRKSQSRSKSRSKRRSLSKRRSTSRRRSKSRGKGKRSVSPKGSKSRSNSRSSRSRSRSPSGSASDDERRGQFTVADRKRFWKMHRNRQEEKEKEPKTPPKEVVPPPGAVESTRVDDIEYGDPPEVEGPNFAELLPPPDQVMQQASSSKSRPIPIPIKNDGSFLEMFKKMQEETKKAEVVEKKPEIKKPALPFIGKRRGGRVLKTGLVKKAKAIDEQTADNTPKDAWSLYMQEVKKYRETSCEEERKTRPLVK